MSWFGRWFSRQQGSVVINSQNLILPKGGALGGQANGESLSWQQLDSPPQFEWRWLGVTMIIRVKGVVYENHFLGYRSTARCAKQVQRLWAAYHQRTLLTLVSKIEQTIDTRYLRQSRLTAIRERVAREYKRWLPWGENTALGEEVKTALGKLTAMHYWNDAALESIRQNFINTQLVRYGDYFDQVESNPLTDKQRRACVIDDDNNLLLAGAGTGKTSVMVGRAGYLLASGQAEPQEILLLAYGKKAASEMDERIKAKLGIDNIKASTFHSLGLKIIAEVEGRKPSLSAWVNDEKAKNVWIQSSLETLLNEPAYREQLFAYFSHHYYVQKSPFDFATQGEYYTYLTDNDIRTFKGQRVKSFGELYIANWLFRNGIEYCYKAKYEFEVVSTDFRQYQPDFYLPDYGVYIEYYSIDENGNTADYIDKGSYHSAMSWKRQLHQTNGTACIELFYHQHVTGQLIPELKRELRAYDVVHSPLPDEAILATLHELNRITELASLFGQLIGLYKAACLDEQGLNKRIANAADSEQIAKALRLLRPVYERYQQHLASNGEIDFEDMIAKALIYVQQRQYVPTWRYIMVDEFQDISEPRARLVRALRDATGQGTIYPASLFCVGDDWQAIYRFSGADVSLTTHFTQYFGATTENVLDVTFRFNNKIGEVATAFVSQNPGQINKNIRSLVEVAEPAISILRRGAQQGPTSQEPSDNALTQALSAITKRINENTQPAQADFESDAVSDRLKPTVYLLARFWFQLPDASALRALNAQFESVHISCLTFHAAKGKEADYGVIMGMTKGKNGFPSNKVTPPLLDALLPQAEAYPFAEERRLFYVALTRAKHRVYVVADMTNASAFVVELMEQANRDDGTSNVELTEFKSSLVQRLFADINCASCETGALNKKLGKFGTFYGCSHFPICDHTEPSCARCHSPMTRTRFMGFKACLDVSCGHSVPLCPECDGDMQLRKSARGAFWGCANYRGKEQPSCQHTIDQNALELPAGRVTSTRD
ncbi:UvrD-helicase domain-containing protein [Paraglaciecola sp. 20A4]|uniref:UvrD-helicase domain-containing protein n=1 Tax=Paraglaciecola sp. 20A4 TaxID=2687288 RepID=UPI001F0E2E15|nr:UvrD-helicase domain-containing protein [Paraglaciecola sp. 20A4]